MNLTLYIPGLFGPGARFSEDYIPRAESLEFLLGRAQQSPIAPASYHASLCKLFDLETPPEHDVPVAALTRLIDADDYAAGCWMRADPVHLRAARDHLALIPSEAFALSGAEADTLASALGPILAGKFTLYPVKPDQWCLRIEHPDESEASASAPIDLAGADIDPHLPAKHWHALLTELQMALHGHAVNTAREARGEPIINSLWLWGAGTLPAAARGPWHSVSAGDPVALGLARLAGMRHRGPGGGAEEWLDRAPEEGRHLVVLERLRAARALGDMQAHARRLQELEDTWFAPLLAALKGGRIGMVTVHVPEAAVSFETVRGDLRRFWRRRRPLTDYRITLA